jgi:hypothetical protein
MIEIYFELYNDSFVEDMSTFFLFDIFHLVSIDMKYSSLYEDSLKIFSNWMTLRELHLLSRTLE